MCHHGFDAVVSEKASDTRVMGTLGRFFDGTAR